MPSFSYKKMCGIWAHVGAYDHLDVAFLFEDFMKLKHRGPMYSSFHHYSDVLVGFHRLSNMSSFQSMVLDHMVFVCNGDIYNYQELNRKYHLQIHGKSDCLTLLKLYQQCGLNDFLSVMKEVQGEFAFLLFCFDPQGNQLESVVAGRDAIGIRPLYYGNNQGNQLIFSSEIKACESFPHPIQEFPPGHVMHFQWKSRSLVTYSFGESMYETLPIALTFPYEVIENTLLSGVHHAVMASVQRRLDADQPMAFLLSGGVDSSLVAALAARMLKPHGKRIHTFCGGLVGQGSDLAFARQVAEFIGSDHTDVLFTETEALSVLKDVIYTTETWDVTTIRASVGQYLVSQYVSQHTDAKVLFVGEGPDEVCSSYLFNWYARLPKDIHPVAVEYVKNIHCYDVKRVDRCIARWGMEARVPLLDPEFIQAYWTIPSEWRHPQYRNMEKYWLRKAFDNDGLLPHSVLWRKKEAFSDGISATDKSWYQIIQSHLQTQFGQDERTYYLHTFELYFGPQRRNLIPGYWQPKWDKDGNVVNDYVDPSARS